MRLWDGVWLMGAGVAVCAVHDKFWCQCERQVEGVWVTLCGRVGMHVCMRVCFVHVCVHVRACMHFYVSGFDSVDQRRNPACHVQSARWRNEQVLLCALHFPFMLVRDQVITSAGNSESSCHTCLVMDHKSLQTLPGRCLAVPNQLLQRGGC